MNELFSQVVAQLKKWFNIENCKLKGRTEFLQELARYRLETGKDRFNLKEIIKFMYPDQDEISPEKEQRITTHYFYQISCLKLNSKELKEEVCESQTTEYCIPDTIFGIADELNVAERRHKQSLFVQCCMVVATILMVIVTFFSLWCSFSSKVPQIENSKMKQLFSRENIKSQRRFTAQDEKIKILTDNVKVLKVKLDKIGGVLAPAVE